MTEIQVDFKRHELLFKFDAGTSRGILRSKDTYYILIRERGGLLGVGEASPLPGLSIDDPQEFEHVLSAACKQLEQTLQYPDENRAPLLQGLEKFPAIRFGIEMAWTSYQSKNPGLYFRTEFVSGNEGIPINGLIWMSDKRNMMRQIKEKLEAGYKCIKMKIGAINFEEECDLLAFIRKQFGPEEIMLRVDANGAFGQDEALEKLKRLSEFELHSIEQPIKPGNTPQLKYLCENTPLPIALDEELIGVSGAQREQLLSEVKPQYIILKPSLLGGFEATNAWIERADQMNIGWWITSALESNVGLNAIAQYTYQVPCTSYQGLGTGQLYQNNIPSPLLIEGGYLYHNPNKKWDFSLLD